MKLELKHLACYLPYGLKVMLTESSKIAEILVLNRVPFRGQIQIQTIYGTHGDMYFKPILRPLSDLFRLIDWDKNGDPYMIGYKCGIKKVFEDGEEFYANVYDADYCESPKSYIDITWFDWWLFEKHFDVFGLIEQGLAIDINTLNK